MNEKERIYEQRIETLEIELEEKQQQIDKLEKLLEINRNRASHPMGNLPVSFPEEYKLTKMEAALLRLILEKKELTFDLFQNDPSLSNIRRKDTTATPQNFRIKISQLREKMHWLTIKNNFGSGYSIDDEGKKALREDMLLKGYR